MDYVNIAISFLGSLGLFLFGMTVLSSALQETTGHKMKHILGTMAKNRFRGVLFGTGVCAAIQSSTATTVMVVGFVNAGIISLSQTVGIIMGANIGSTTTSWLVSSAEWAAFLKPDAIGAVCAILGALMLLFVNKKNLRNIAQVVVGFGVLFIGLSQMPIAVKPLAELDVLRRMFITLGSNPLLAFLSGVIVTGIIQSSAASIGILQSMAFTGMIPWNAAVFIILGQNVGTCFTTMLTSIGTNRNARAAANIHFLYNILGATIFGGLSFLFFTFFNPAVGTMAASSVHVSMIHTGYNILLLFLLFPYGGSILKIALKMAGPEKEDVARIPYLAQLDENILATPSFALNNSTNAFCGLVELVRSNLAISLDAFINKKYDSLHTFWSNADDIDKINEGISTFLTKLYNEELSKEDAVSTTTLLHSLISLRRISNHSKGLAKLAGDVRDGNFSYPGIAIAKMQEISEATLRCYDNMFEAFKHKTPELISITITNAEDVFTLREEYKSEHFAQASSGGYNVQSGLMCAEAVRHMARIAINSKSVIDSLEITGDLTQHVNE